MVNEHMYQEQHSGAFKASTLGNHMHDITHAFKKWYVVAATFKLGDDMHDITWSRNGVLYTCAAVELEL